MRSGISHQQGKRSGRADSWPGFKAAASRFMLIRRAEGPKVYSPGCRPGLPLQKSPALKGRHQSSLVPKVALIEGKTALLQQRSEFVLKTQPPIAPMMLLLFLDVLL